MKLTVFLTIVSLLQIHANSYSQSKRITLDMGNVSVTEVLNEIESVSEFKFLFNRKDVDLDRHVSIKVTKKPITTILDELFSGTDVGFEVLNKQIILSKLINKTVPKNTIGSTEINIKPQQFPISGTVTDENGQPLPGANIVEKGTTNGVTADFDGNFTIDIANENAILVISYIGFATKEVEVNGQSTLSLVLEESTAGLDEVVIVGYGVQKKQDVTAAVSTVSGAEMVKMNGATDLRQVLQGELAGLNISDKGGAPGGSVTAMNVRGITTIGNNEPLVLVDGIENPDFNLINTNDIQSVTLLKDAASTSIYGSRASNGVLLITTKRAKEGKTMVSYNGYFGWQKSIQNLTHMPIGDYMRQQNIAYTNSFGAPIYSEEEINTWVNSTDRLKYPLPNTWQDAMYNVAPQQNHNITVSGGNEQIKSLVSMRYLDQDGIIANFGQNILEVRVNNDITITEKLNFSVDVSYINNKISEPSNYNAVFSRMVQTSQWTVPKYPDGTYGISSDGHNPLFYAEGNGTYKQDNTTLSANFNAKWDFFDGFSFRPHIGTRLWQSNNKRYFNKYEIRDFYDPEIIRKQNPINNMTVAKNNSEEVTVDLLLNYTKSIDDIHNIDALFGYSEIYHQNDDLSGFRQDFYNNQIQSLSAGADDASKRNGGREYSWGLRSFFWRLNYNLKDTYLFEANARYDGSSRFTGNNKYSFFPSYSAGWRLSKEDFWHSLTDVVNEFKIRSSWGQTGNQAVGLYSYIETLSPRTYPFGANLEQGYLITDLADPDLGWETTTQFDIGFDTQWFNGQIQLNVDYYKKRTNDILLALPIPALVGLNPSVQNAGVLDNEGFELEFGYRHFFNNDFSFNFSQLVTYNKNTVIDLAGTGPFIQGDSEIRTITAEGHPYREFWGYKTDGLFQTVDEVTNYPTISTGAAPGDVKYIDLNNDGMITPADMTYLGGGYFPKWNFASNFTFKYKNISLDAFFQGVAGAKRYIGGAIMQAGIWGGFTSDIFTNNQWTPENPNAEFPRPTKFEVRNTQLSDRSIQNGAYLRLKNIRLAYQVPSSWTSFIGIESANLYVAGTNLLTFSELNRWEVNPESDNRDGDNIYPQTSVYSIGVNINF